MSNLSKYVGKKINIVDINNKNGKEEELVVIRQVIQKTVIGI
ncbi:hypothetical protein [Lactobacillus hominis]|uniref:Uncharacterized protein n=1 Tax=Lactobacillus hominis DSM 23910 = CRBIP 24.179 TaxID=1423758 RepID=I7LAZ2_9LACO|nr:hypothetical protein [Lactobacillus hominis]CCI82684.1 Protein of unknown function [Lactobacillus hominis DSM 23910 = CRBIP 24.179]